MGTSDCWRCPPGVDRRAGVRAVAAAIVCGGAITAARPAVADEVIRPCKPGTSAYKAARKALDDLDADIRKLEPAGDPTPLEKRLAALGENECFRIVGTLSVDAKNGLALRTWWEDGAGAVPAGALDLGAERPTIWVAPDLRRALTRE